MQSVRYTWSDADRDHAFELVHVRGTHGEPFAFGEAASTLLVDVPDFFLATVPVTQRLWTHLMGADANPSVNRGPDLPMENASWDELTRPGGMLQRLDDSSMAGAVRVQSIPRDGGTNEMRGMGHRHPRRDMHGSA